MITLGYLKTVVSGLLPKSWHAAIYRRKFEYLLQFPRSIYIEVTSACNLNCIMCPTQRLVVKKHKKDGFMDIGFFRRLIDEISSEDSDIDVRLYKNGEPLLHPEIIDFIYYASSRLHNITLVTNATLLNENMARAILNTQLKTIRFSVDGLTKQTFEKVRRQHPDNPYADQSIQVNYESVMNNIIRFCELKKKLGKDLPKVGVRITNFDATKHELDDYCSYWGKKVDFVEVSSLLSWSGKISYETSDITHRYPCLSLWGQMAINWDGTTVPCCLYVDTIGDKKGILSDLNELSIRAAWHSLVLNQIRLAHLDNEIDKVAPFCKSCRDWRISSPPGKELWNKRFKAYLRAVALKDMCNKAV